MLTGLRARGLAAAIMLLSAIPVLGQKAGDPRDTAISLLALYEAGHYADVEASLAARPKGPIASALRRDGDRWISGGAPETRDHRRLIAGAVALEIAAAGLIDEWFDVYEAIEWGCRHVLAVRPGLELEHDWHLASIALLQAGSGMLPTTKFGGDHLRKHALMRFSDSAPIQLGILIDDDRAMPLVPPRRIDGREREIIARYLALAQRVQVGEEARVRLAAFRHRVGDSATALRELTTGDPPSDPHLAFVAAFLSAEIHRSAGRHPEAQDHYRKALAVTPNAMSAALGLSASLLAAGDLVAAQAASTGAVSRAAPEDPWRLFAYGAGRQWPHWRDRLRSGLRR